MEPMAENPLIYPRKPFEAIALRPEIAPSILNEVRSRWFRACWCWHPR
jgi:hypothetical protein